MNVFVIKSVIKDVSMATIFKGVLPFVATDMIRLLLLILFRCWQHGCRTGMVG